MKVKQRFVLTRHSQFGRRNSQKIGGFELHKSWKIFTRYTARLNQILEKEYWLRTATLCSEIITCEVEGKRESRSRSIARYRGIKMEICIEHSIQKKKTFNPWTNVRSDKLEECDQYKHRINKHKWPYSYSHRNQLHMKWKFLQVLLVLKTTSCLPNGHWQCNIWSCIKNNSDSYSERVRNSLGQKTTPWRWLQESRIWLPLEDGKYSMQSWCGVPKWICQKSTAKKIKWLDMVVAEA